MEIKNLLGKLTLFEVRKDSITKSCNTCRQYSKLLFKYDYDILNKSKSRNLFT